MKEKISYYKSNVLLLLIFCALSMSLSACSDDDDDNFVSNGETATVFSGSGNAVFSRGGVDSYMQCLSEGLLVDTQAIDSIGTVLTGALRKTLTLTKCALFTG